MNSMFSLAIVVFVIGIVLLFLYLLLAKKLGWVGKSIVYTDSKEHPGKLIRSEKYLLVGKPDYIRKYKGQFIPVEYKSGKTPWKPYENHIMQLMAYCLLVEEEYQKRPDFGVLKYDGKEFPIKFTNENRQRVLRLVDEIKMAKRTNTEFLCQHKYHN